MKNFKLIFLFIVQTSLFGQGITVSNNSIFDLGSAILSISSNWINNGTFNTSNGTIGFSDALGDQEYTDENNSPINNLLVNKTVGNVLLMDSITVNGTLTCTSGDIDLNGKIIFLGNTATVNEAASATVMGNSGHIEATRDLNVPNSNVAGLGLTITSAQNMGSTKIIRAHNAQTTNSNGSINRAFDVTPTNNTNLNATIVFSYDDDELNGLNEADLQLYKSTDGGLTWFTQGGALDVAANTVTLAGVQDFSLWTLGVNEGPVISNSGGIINCPESTPVKIFDTLLLSDPDDINNEGAVIQITNNYLVAEDKLEFTDQNGITGAWDSGAGKLTLSGSASKDDYVTAIRSVKYRNSSTSPTESIRTISIYTNDGNNNSNTITRDVEVHESNNIPSLVVNNNGYVDEGGVFIFSDQNLRAQDADGSTFSITFNVVEEPLYGTLSFNSALLKTGSIVSFTQNDIANGKLQYQHNSGEESTDFFKFYLVDDVGGKSNNYTFTININGMNDSPQIDSLSAVVMQEDESMILQLRNWYSCITDPDDMDSTLTFSVSCLNENICITPLSDTTCEIASALNYFGNDSLDVVVYDASGDSCLAKAFLMIEPVNDLPVFAGLPPVFNVVCGSVGTLHICECLSDVESPDSLIYVGVETNSDSVFCSYDSENGIINILAMGSYVGEVTITIIAIDENGGKSEAELIVNIEEDVTDIAGEQDLPVDYVLSQNYPNPFNPSTVIRYGIPAGTWHAMSVQLRVYDILGNEVVTLVNESQTPGYHEVYWNAQNNASGIYFYVLIVQGGTENKKIAKKMILVK